LNPPLAIAFSDQNQRREIGDLGEVETAVDGAQRSSDPVAEEENPWNTWFDARFMELTRPVLEATGKHIAEQLDEERRQSREELALEVQRLSAESARLFAVITELQQTLKSLGRIEAASKRDDALGLPRHDVH
jgi:hypothetical protein